MASTSNENTLRIFYNLDESMLKAHRRDDNEEAESIAHELLSHADLPLIIRARAGMVLAFSDDEDFLDQAKEAVRIAEIAVASDTEYTERANSLLISCKDVLEKATKRFETMQAEEGTEREEGDEEVAEDSEVVLVWKDGKPIAVGSHFADLEASKKAADDAEK